MPIKAENKGRYPKDWKQIRERILERAGHKCERCGVPNYVYRIVGTDEYSANEDAAYLLAAPGAKVTRIVLTIMHLDHVPEHCDDTNLQAACQKCHLAYDHDHHQHNAAETRRGRKAIGELFA